MFGSPIVAYDPLVRGQVSRKTGREKRGKARIKWPARDRAVAHSGVRGAGRGSYISYHIGQRPEDGTVVERGRRATGEKRKGQTVAQAARQERELKAQTRKRRYAGATYSDSWQAPQ